MNFPLCITSIASGCWLRPALLLALAVLAAGRTDAGAAPATTLLTFTGFTNFTRTTKEDETVLLSPELDAGLAWDELIASWNATMATNGTLVCEARALATNGPTRWFNLGRWNTAATATARTSIKDQHDETARVETDTLILKQPASRVQVRVTLQGADTRLKFLALCLTGVHHPHESKPPRKAAWGKIIAVPVRSQADYPEGVTKWCSPTCTTMLLAHWAGELHRPELDFDVRTTAAKVFDLAWDGTGNWPFNMAFAGSQPGLRACVARLEDVADLEEWTGRGLPVAVSLSYTLLQGSPVPLPENGHLVVVCGFTAAGDVVVNDPGVRHERVRRTFPRADFARAWAHSQRTVYLVWPETLAVPWPMGPR